MGKELIAAAMLVFASTAIRAEPDDEADAAIMMDAAPDDSSSAPAPDPGESAPHRSTTTSPAPSRSQRGSAAPAPQAQSSGAPEPEAGAVHAPAPDSPEPSQPPPAKAADASSPVLGGKIGSSWTPEGSGIDELGEEFDKFQAAHKAWQEYCAKQAAAWDAAAHPREYTGRPSETQMHAGLSAMKAAGIDYMDRGCLEILSCGGTPADCVRTLSEACTRFQTPTAAPGTSNFATGCYHANMFMHNGGTFWGAAFCAGKPLPIGKCFSEQTIDGAMKQTFDPAEVLRRASFGAHWNGDFTVGPSAEGRPDHLDGRQILTARLAYFDSLKDDFEGLGVDPQLIYVLIMTHVIWEKCESGDYFCVSFTNMPKISSFRGVTLTQYLQRMRSATR